MLLEKSTITSGFLASMLVGVASYCTIAQIPVPEYFTFAIGAVVAWFFTSKAKDQEFRQFMRALNQE